MKTTIEEIEVAGKKARFDGKFWIDGDGIRHRYVDPMNDEGFKLLFGTEGNEELLMDLLNTIIPGADIVDLKYNNVEHNGMVQGDNKAIFDVYCEDRDGVRFLVEMQNWSQRHFNKRAVYYSTYAIQDQAAKEKRHQLKTLGKDRWDYNYAPVYVVCFLSFEMRRPPRELEMIRQEERYMSLYRYKDLETQEELGDGTTLVFVEMMKFRKGLSDCMTAREQWLHSMKNMSIQLEVPDEITDQRLREVYTKAEIAAMPREKRITYISHIMSRNDELNSRAEMLESALAEGRAKGMEEGREIGLREGIREGLEEGKKATAAKLKQLGVDMQTIVQATGLDEEVISWL